MGYTRHFETSFHGFLYLSFNLLIKKDGLASDSLACIPALTRGHLMLLFQGCLTQTRVWNKSLCPPAPSSQGLASTPLPEPTPGELLRAFLQNVRCVKCMKIKQSDAETPGPSEEGTAHHQRRTSPDGQCDFCIFQMLLLGPFQNKPENRPL